MVKQKIKLSNKVIVFLFSMFMVFISTNITMAVNLPFSTVRPLMLLTQARLSLLNTKKQGNETSYNYTKTRMSNYLPGGTYPWETAEASAAMALLYNIDNTLVNYRDRAISLMFDFFVDENSGHYWGSSNAPVSQLTFGITASDTIIPITDSSVFSTYYNIARVGNELIRYTGKTPTELTGCTRGIMGTVASTHNSGDYAEYIQGTFADGDKMRWFSSLGILAFDWVYNDLTPTQRIQMQDKIKIWCKYWENTINPPTFAGNPYGHDSDQILAIYQLLSYGGYALYNDDNYAIDLFTTADNMMTNLIVPNYLNGSMAGGMWGEGTNYSAFTVQMYMIPALISKEQRGLSDVNINKHIHDSLLFWWYALLPGNTSFLQWSDMEGTTSDYINLSKHNRLQLAFVLQGTGVNEDRGLAKSLSNTMITTNGEPDSSILYSGMLRLLFDDPSVVPVTETTLPNNFTSSGMRFHAMRTGWGGDDDAVYLYGAKDEYDHSHWTAGHYDIADSGVWITKEATGYGYTLVSGSAYSHNSLTMSGAQNSQQDNTSGTYANNNSIIDTAYYSSDYSFVQHDLKGLYNFNGYQAETPMHRYNRRLFYLKNKKTVIVNDFVSISQDSNCTWDGVNHLQNATLACYPRDIKIHQRFLAEPTLEAGVFSANNEGHTFMYKPLLGNATKSIVNEATTAPWNLATQSDLPDNQRKWQVITAATLIGSDDYLSILHWGDVGTTIMPITTIKNNTEDVITIAIDNDIVSMSKTGEMLTQSIVYSVTGSSSHYITNLPTNTLINVTLNGSEIAGSPFNSGSDGIIDFVSATGTILISAEGIEIRADVDQNGAVNSTDAMLTLRNSLGLDMTSTSWQASSTTGDVNCNGNSNSTDAMLILRQSLGLDMTGTGWCGS